MDSERKCINVLKACFVRFLLIFHNIVAVWRVTVAWGRDTLWLLALGNLTLTLEGYYTVVKNRAIECKWFCPCFLVYLLTTLPTIWLLQISELDNDLNALGGHHGNKSAELGHGRLDGNYTTEDLPLEVLSSFGDRAWSVITEESLVYLLVLSRWLLPRGEVTREALSDLLIDYLAIASDIMELFALFDIKKIHARSDVTYAILIIWSASFLQFVPVMAHRRIYNKIQSPTLPTEWIMKTCGEHFSEIVALCMGIVLQDGPFLVLRLWIIVYMDVLTYSLVFFVVKNIAVILLLLYKLMVLCTKVPCCNKVGRGTIVGVVSVDWGHPVDVKETPTVDEMFR